MFHRQPKRINNHFYVLKHLIVYIHKEKTETKQNRNTDDDFKL